MMTVSASPNRFNPASAFQVHATGPINPDKPAGPASDGPQKPEDDSGKPRVPNTQE